MGFEALLGNERLKENLRRSIDRGRISHFYLISGPAGSGKRTLARLLAAAILCRSGQGKPCGACPACRKVLGAGHPEKKTVPVDLVRQARSDMYIRPNEADRKIYLFPRGQDMAEPSQNALLKILEEPPSYGVFLLLTENPEKLLPTVRSRCTELSLTALPEPLLRQELQRRFPQAEGDTLQNAITRSGGFLGQALTLMEEGSQLPAQTTDFLAAYAAKDSYRLLQVLVPMEKLGREALIALLSQWRGLLEGALVYRAGMGATPMAKELSSSRSGQELLQAIRHLEKTIEYAQGNVSPAAICGYLSWHLR